jgi:hypothetical protein
MLAKSVVNVANVTSPFLCAVEHLGRQSRSGNGFSMKRVIRPSSATR